MNEKCAICGCPLHRLQDTYARPTPEGRSHASKHHYVPERFFGRSNNRKGTQRERMFHQCPWGHEGKTDVFCYDCHEELLHNPIFLPEDIECFAHIVKQRGLSEDGKTYSREMIAGRIKLLHEVIAYGLKATMTDPGWSFGPQQPTEYRTADLEWPIGFREPPITELEIIAIVESAGVKFSKEGITDVYHAIGQYFLDIHNKNLRPTLKEKRERIKTLRDAAEELTKRLDVLSLYGPYLEIDLDERSRRIGLHPLSWTKCVRVPGRTPDPREGKKGSCHEATQNLQKRVQAPGD